MPAESALTLLALSLTVGARPSHVQTSRFAQHSTATARAVHFAPIASSKSPATGVSVASRPFTPTPRPLNMRSTPHLEAVLTSPVARSLELPRESEGGSTEYVKFDVEEDPNTGDKSILKDGQRHWVVGYHRRRPSLGSRTLDGGMQNDDIVAKTTLQALNEGHKVVLTIGETKDADVLSVITRQLIAVSLRVSSKYFEEGRIIIGYQSPEPITQKKANEVSLMLDRILRNSIGAEDVPVLFFQRNAQQELSLTSHPGGPAAAGVAEKSPKRWEGTNIADKVMEKVQPFWLSKETTKKSSSPVMKAAPMKKIKSKASTRAPKQVAKARRRFPVDWAAMTRYVTATGVQFSLITGFLFAVQEAFKFYGYSVVPTPVAAGIFGILALRSRIFSVMDNSRPKASINDQVFRRKTPSWMPAPIVFPIVWTAIAIMRTVSSVVAFKAAGQTLLAAPLLAMLAHLSIGDTWNTINNVERRIGTAFVGVLGVLASVITVEALFYQLSPLAGAILAPSVLWISIATFLVGEIYRLNNPKDGSEPLYPVRGRARAPWALPFTSINK
ncbi:hypothetical protein AAMO2058_000768000 [Amorphochlora amoebiformis]